MFYYERYRPLKLPLSCEVVEKGGFGPRFVGAGCSKNLNTYILKSHSLPSMAGFGGVPFREIGVQLMRKRKR